MKDISIPEAPVLLITFNRPDYTIQVLEKIREAKVKRLYIANDAPRNGNQADEKAREEIKALIASKVDWECELYTLFQEKNLGCGWGPATAISWAFENEDRLIILEDDIVPSLAFFPYCNLMLEMYKNDTRIWLISGRSHQSNSQYFDNQDYIFSHYGHSWGWATWKRCWQHFDMRMSDFPNFIKMGGAFNVLSSKEEGKLYNNLYKKLAEDKKLETHAWDFQFGYSILKNGGLSIVPAKNLIHNIGIFGTHYSGIANKYTSLLAVEDFKVEKHPKFVIVNKAYEKLHFNSHIKKIMGATPLYKKVFRKIKRMLACKK
jgi:hypothetical protein